jgi:hypothetical protein
MVEALFFDINCSWITTCVYSWATEAKGATPAEPQARMSWPQRTQRSQSGQPQPKSIEPRQGGIPRIKQGPLNAKTRRRSAADAATKGFEREHTEETEKKQGEVKILSNMRNSWG